MELKKSKIFILLVLAIAILLIITTAVMVVIFLIQHASDISTALSLSFNVIEDLYLEEPYLLRKDLK